MAWPGVKYETKFFSKNVCLHRIRTAASFSSQNTKSSVNDFLKPGNEKGFFYGNLYFLPQSQLKNIFVDEILITRESIGGHFRHSGLAWGQI